MLHFVEHSSIYMLKSARILRELPVIDKTPQTFNILPIVTKTKTLFP
jgi:hypothetical protein